jgi:hypothetical protein
MYFAIEVVIVSFLWWIRVLAVGQWDLYLNPHMLTNTPAKGVEVLCLCVTRFFACPCSRYVS